MSANDMVIAVVIFAPWHVNVLHTLRRGLSILNLDLGSVSSTISQWIA